MWFVSVVVVVVVVGGGVVVVLVIYLLVSVLVFSSSSPTTPPLSLHAKYPRGTSVCERVCESVQSKVAARSVIFLRKLVFYKNRSIYVDFTCR